MSPRNTIQSQLMGNIKCKFIENLRPRGREPQGKNQEQICTGFCCLLSCPKCVGYVLIFQPIAATSVADCALIEVSTVSAVPNLKWMRSCFAFARWLVTFLVYVRIRPCNAIVFRNRLWQAKIAIIFSKIWVNPFCWCQNNVEIQKKFEPTYAEVFSGKQ